MVLHRGVLLRPNPSHLQGTPPLARLRECRPHHCFTVKSATIQFQRSLQEGRARDSHQILTISLADTVRAYGRGVPNYIGPRVPVSFLHFNLLAWESHLKTYDDKIVVDFLKFGWSINCDTTVLPKSTLKNHGSAAGANGERVLNTHISKEFQSVCRPYQRNSFSTDCLIRPLQCVSKRDSTEPRIVHDLSFPPEASMNSRIPSHSFLNVLYKLTLPGIDRLVEFVNRLGRGCHVFKKTSNEHIVKFSGSG